MLIERSKKCSPRTVQCWKQQTYDTQRDFFAVLHENKEARKGERIEGPLSASKEMLTFYPNL